MVLHPAPELCRACADPLQPDCSLRTCPGTSGKGEVDFLKVLPKNEHSSKPLKGEAAQQPDWNAGVLLLYTSLAAARHFD